MFGIYDITLYYSLRSVGLWTIRHAEVKWLGVGTTMQAAQVQTPVDVEPLTCVCKG